MKKLITLLMLIALFTTSMSFAIYDPMQYDTVIIKDNNEWVEMDVQYPMLKGSKPGMHSLNAIIEGLVNVELDKLTEEAKQLQVDFKDNNWEFRKASFYTNFEVNGFGNNIVSIKLTIYPSTGGTGMPQVYTYTYDKVEDTVLGMLDGRFFEVSPEFINILEENIDEQMTAEIAEGQVYSVEVSEDIAEEADNLYLREGNLVLQYNKYAIAAGASGEQEFFIPMMDLQDHLGDIFMRIELMSVGGPEEDTGVFTDLASLREVGKTLGYEVQWNAESRTVELVNDDTIITYSLDDQMMRINNQAVELTQSPVNIDGHIYLSDKDVELLIEAVR